jgi:hypothetical protein
MKLFAAWYYPVIPQKVLKHENLLCLVKNHTAFFSNKRYYLSYPA